MAAKGQKGPGATMPAQRILCGLGAANIAAWIWAAEAFVGVPRLLGMAGLAWLFGLRHAMDADHIAAIDNAVQRLAERDRCPATTGLFFSLGHSTVVVLLAAAVSLGARALRMHLDAVTHYGAWIGTIVSVVFLVLIAGANLTAFRAETRGGAAPGGVLTWLARPLFRLVRRSRDMYAIGFLFGLVFDTATEIGLLALSAAIAVVVGGAELLGLTEHSFGSGLSRVTALLAAHWSELGMAIALMLAGLFLAAIRRSRADATIAGRSPSGSAARLTPGAMRAWC